MSMARYSASRTRASLNGLRSFTSLFGSVSFRFIAKYTVRSSLLCITFTPGAAESRGRSCSGATLVKSISPESIAATRVAAEAIGVNSIRARLCCGLSHHFGFTTNTVRASGRRDSTMNGPVPLALSVA